MTAFDNFVTQSRSLDMAGLWKVLSLFGGYILNVTLLYSNKIIENA